MSINRVNISGNIGREPELRATQGGTHVLTFSVAVSDRKRNPNTDEWEDVTNWIPCVIFGNRAESLSRFLTKGMKVALEGKLRQSTYQDKSGNSRSKIEVVVSDVEFMRRTSDSKAQNGRGGGQMGNYTVNQQNGRNMAPQASQNGYQDELYDEDMPF